MKTGPRKYPLKQEAAPVTGGCFFEFKELPDGGAFKSLRYHDRNSGNAEPMMAHFFSVDVVDVPSIEESSKMQVQRSIIW